MEIEMKKIPMVEFLCHCTHTRSAARNASLNPSQCDEEGFVVCPVHKVRRCGWMSAPRTRQRVARHADSPEADEEFIERPDYSYGMDYLAMEKVALGVLV
jgi:hypothetical protein